MDLLLHHLGRIGRGFVPVAGSAAFGAALFGMLYITVLHPILMLILVIIFACWLMGEP